MMQGYLLATGTSGLLSDHNRLNSNPTIDCKRASPLTSRTDRVLLSRKPNCDIKIFVIRGGVSSTPIPSTDNHVLSAPAPPSANPGSSTLPGHLLVGLSNGSAPTRDLASSNFPMGREMRSFTEAC